MRGRTVRQARWHVPHTSVHDSDPRNHRRLTHCTNRPDLIEGDRDNFVSAGVSIANALVFNPRDTWGVGFARTALDSGHTEYLTEGYYNFRLADRLRLSFSLQHVLNTPETEAKFGYLLPGIRLQAAF